MDKDEQSELYYENIIIATDADSDGTSIKSLLLCFFNRFAKSLIEQKRILFLETPLVLAKQKGKTKHAFKNFEEYNTFKSNTTDKYDYFYIKGLGSNRKDDLKDMIQKAGLKKFLHPFEVDAASDTSITSWMSKTGVDKRKEYLRGRSFDISGV